MKPIRGPDKHFLFMIFSVAPSVEDVVSHAAAPVSSALIVISTYPTQSDQVELDRVIGLRYGIVTPHAGPVFARCVR